MNDDPRARRTSPDALPATPPGGRPPRTPPRGTHVPGAPGHGTPAPAGPPRGARTPGTPPRGTAAPGGPPSGARSSGGPPSGTARLGTPPGGASALDAAGAGPWIVPPEGSGIELPPLPYRPAGARARRRRTRLLFGAGGAAIVLVAAGAGAALYSSGGDVRRAAAPKGTVPAAWAAEAARVVGALPAVRFDATLGDGGTAVRARLRVTRQGSATGKVTASGADADLVTVAGATYLKGGESFWRATRDAGDGRPADYAGRWTKAPASVFGVDVRGALAPAAVGKALAKGPGGTETTGPGGVPAYRVTTRRAEYVITREAPFRLLSVRVGDGPVFTATPLDDAAPVFSSVRSRAAALGGAVDPALRFAPGTLSFVNCDQNVDSCTVSVPATLSAPDRVPDGARAELTATVTAEGASLGSCKAAAAVPSNGSMVLRCTVAGGAWRAFVKRAMDSPGRHPYGATARIVGQAVAPGDVAALLARIDRERAAQPRNAVAGTPATGGATAPASPRATP
ncbi:hypothetical protein [Actinomadura atramentaria]|uniref:hypothetical protein n=1 Tax=Actinomadura atramentaria TaxID=1990 RepID=UPI0003A66C50|nr:hypothetical protein [Actinomadura atramentaria]